MEKCKHIPGVPSQEKGAYHDTESEKCFDSAVTAAEQYKILKERFLDFNAWHTYVGGASAKFFLCDSRGDAVSREPKIGDYVKIDIPGPGSSAGDGFDWVQITQIDNHPYEEDERCFIQCVPSKNPLDENNDAIAHFYTNEASSNFIIGRKNQCIYASIYGRNEVSNDENNGLMDKARNALISIGGRVGLSKMQWKTIAEGLLNF